MADHNNHKSLFGLLRHGETKWNREKRIQGSGDSALTKEGIVSSRSWGYFLKQGEITWSRIIVSPLERAKQTAELINETLHLPIVVEPLLRELNWGEWEGLTLEQVKADFSEELRERTRQGWDFSPPGGESRKQLLTRVRAGLERSQKRWPRDTMLIVSHLGVIKALLYHAEGREFLPEEPKILYRNRFHTISLYKGKLTVIDKNISLPEQP